MIFLLFLPKFTGNLGQGRNLLLIGVWKSFIPVRPMIPMVPLIPMIPVIPMILAIPAIDSLPYLFIPVLLPERAELKIRYVP